MGLVFMPERLLTYRQPYFGMRKKSVVYFEAFVRICPCVPRRAGRNVGLPSINRIQACPQLYDNRRYAEAAAEVRTHW